MKLSDAIDQLRTANQAEEKAIKARQSVVTVVIDAVEKKLSRRWEPLTSVRVGNEWLTLTEFRQGIKIGRVQTVDPDSDL